MIYCNESYINVVSSLKMSYCTNSHFHLKETLHGFLLALPASLFLSFVAIMKENKGYLNTNTKIYTNWVDNWGSY